MIKIFHVWILNQDICLWTLLEQVTDATVDTLLQNCAKLQSLTLSSCPGVTDLTLHNISKYTPCIRYRHMDTHKHNNRPPCFALIPYRLSGLQL